MASLYDIAYVLGLTVAAPVWLTAPKMRRKVFKAFSLRTGRRLPLPNSGPAVLIHAVSLGEINATVGMVRLLARDRPKVQVVVSVTTDTGYARGQQLYGANPNVTLIRYPLDFSGAVGRVLDTYQPAAVALMELEVWPNFIRCCARRGIAVLLVNGRLTTSSFGNYRRVKLLLAPTFRRLRAVCAQDRVYADRFIALGCPRERVRVTGTMKFDTAEIVDRIDGADEIARSVGLTAAPAPIWVCGSTGPGEEAILLRCYRRLLDRHPALRLVLTPRHPERFDEAADLIRAARFPLVRRSQRVSPSPDPVRDAPVAEVGAVVLGDTMGELRAFYSLARVVFVGRSLVDLGPRQHGSDMIEPAALAKPVVVGPWTHNFADAMARLRDADAVRVVADENALFAAIDRLLSDPASASAMGARAREVVRQQQGATARCVEKILQCLPARAGG